MKKNMLFLGMLFVAGVVCAAGPSKSSNQPQNGVNVGPLQSNGSQNSIQGDSNSSVLLQLPSLTPEEEEFLATPVSIPEEFNPSSVLWSSENK